MKTTKPKYAPIDATVAGIPAAEPVFLLRAQDKHAVAALKFYADRVQADGGDPNVVAATRQSITDFAAWPVKKAPDLYAPETAAGEPIQAAGESAAGGENGGEASGEAAGGENGGEASGEAAGGENGGEASGEAGGEGESAAESEEGSARSRRRAKKGDEG